MKAIKLASTGHDRTKLRVKCKELLSRAEEIKKLNVWPPLQSSGTTLRAPASERTISRAEEIILLEGSKLHGSIFPPWASEPDEAVFTGGDSIYT